MSVMEWFKKLFCNNNQSGAMNSKDTKNLNLQKLTPTKCDNMEYYKESLDFVFNDPDLLNVAITGAYSAGKSSVIQTYEDLNKDKRFIHISLAYFEQLNNSNTDEKETSKKSNEIELEGKIINQLIHQIDPIKIPMTRFKIKYNITGGKVLKHTILLGVLAILLLYVLKFKEWTTIIRQSDNTAMKDILYFTTRSESFIFSLILGTVIFLRYLYQIIKMQMQKPIFKKVKLQNTEIEIFEKDDESYFDKYLDEILYLFKNANVDAIVFEDIDRYNNNVIFSKLREINFLVNKRSGKKPIRFLYLIRDDIFTSKDRTKFFDFMMPVVPVIDSSNSYDQVLKYFEDGDIIKNFDKSFLERLSLYIDDMRILKNIYNEYVIYHGRIQSTELNCNKLLAMIAYKNIFPKDFSDLQLNSGLVYHIFANKDNTIESCRKTIDAKIQNNLLKIKSIKNEQLNDLDELDTLYLTSGQYNYLVDDKLENNFNNRLEYVKSLKKPGTRVEIYNSYSGYNTYNIQATLDEMRKKPDYIARKNIIDQKMNNGIHELEEENVKLQNEKNRLNSLKMRELITKDNIDEVFKYNLLDEDGKLTKFEDIVNNQCYRLIKYLIRNGYIDETYFDYLTYFYENSLTRSDKIFLRSITDEIAKDHKYKLKDKAAIVSRLKVSDFEKEETLNFDLLDYILENEHSYLSTLLKQIKDNRRFDFAWEYLIQATNVGKFVRKLNATWQELWIYLLLDQNITEEQRKKYMIYTLYYSSVEEIQAMNIKHCITDYLSAKTDFLDITEPNINLIISGLIALNIQFEHIDYEKSNKELFNEVYKNNLYVLNFPMIKLILEKIYNFSNINEFKRKNYTLISSKPDEPLKLYTEENINLYIKVLLENLDGRIIDSEGDVLHILNNNDIEINDKVLYIKNLSTVISDINDISDKDNLWEELLRNNIIEYSTHNALAYYFMYAASIDDTLINFLNDNPSTIIFNYGDIEKEFEGQGILKFFAEVITNKGLTNKKYEIILKGYQHIINEFTYEDIEDDKLKIIIRLGIIGMTKENIKFVRANYSNLLIYFIYNNIQEYIDCLDDEITNHDEILSLLDKGNIADEYKIVLIEKTPNTISLVNHDYSEEVQLFIIKNKFDNNDLEYLIKLYEKSSPATKDAIQKLCILNIEEISDNQLILSYNLLYEIMSNVEVDSSYKKRVLYYHLDLLNVDKIKKCMSDAKLIDFVGLFEGKRPKVPITDENQNILIYFKEKGWIASFDEETTSPGYYRVRGKKYTEKQNNTLPVDLL
jgi:hypothetical protein